MREIVKRLPWLVLAEWVLLTVCAALSPRSPSGPFPVGIHALTTSDLRSNSARYYCLLWWLTSACVRIIKRRSNSLPVDRLDHCFLMHPPRGLDTCRNLSC
jgi:hypothetical protein